MEVARRRARLLALELAAIDPERDSLERRLVGHGIHPALAYESANWAEGHGQRCSGGRLGRELAGPGDDATATPTDPGAAL